MPVVQGQARSRRGKLICRRCRTHHVASPVKALKSIGGYRGVTQLLCRSENANGMRDNLDLHGSCAKNFSVAMKRARPIRG
jgi:hypothetical protein